MKVLGLESQLKLLKAQIAELGPNQNMDAEMP